MAALVTTGAVIVPAEKVEAVEVLLKPSKSADLDMLVSRLNRSCAVLLVLSILRAGSKEGMFAFLAAVSVLCCSLPGARGVAISARFAKVYAFVAAVLAVHSCAVPMVALVHGVPMEVVEEVQLRCESMDPALAESLMGWAHNATQAWHERFHKEEDGPFSHGRIGHGPGHGHNDERFHEEPSVMTDRCCLPVDNVKVAQSTGAVMGEPCTGTGACLLIEAGDTFSCEIDPGYFTSAHQCATDTGIWCDGHTCAEPTTRCAKLSRGFKQARLDGSLPRPSSPRGAGRLRTRPCLPARGRPHSSLQGGLHSP